MTRTPTGTIISRVTNDISLVQGAVSDTFTAVLKDAFAIIGAYLRSLLPDWQLAIVAFVVLPVAIYPIATFGKKLRKNSTQNQKAMARFTNFLHETITGQRIVKAFAMEDYEYGSFEEENESLFRIVLKRYKIRALSSPVMEVFAGIAVAMIIWYGGSTVIAGQSTPGKFFSFMLALVLSVQAHKAGQQGKPQHPAGPCALPNGSSRSSTGDPEITERRRRWSWGTPRESIEFDQVSFKYEEKMVLRDINLTSNKNETIAIVGESGGGKTTLVNLILRFYDVTEGSISIDGIDVRDMTLDSLRRNIALVTQDVILFNDTIPSNIIHGIGEDPDSMEQAVRSAYALDFVSKMPKKLDTVVGEKGREALGRAEAENSHSAGAL